jgi:hypothetical protein
LSKRSSRQAPETTALHPIAQLHSKTHLVRGNQKLALLSDEMSHGDLRKRDIPEASEHHFGVALPGEND